MSGLLFSLHTLYTTYEVFALNFLMLYLNYYFFSSSPIGVVPGQQNSPQPQFIIQPHGMPMAAVQTVGQAGGQGTPVGGAPGVGGQMQGPPGGPGQWGGQFPYFVEEEFSSLNNNNHHPAQGPAHLFPFPYISYAPAMPIGSVKKAVINNNR